MPYHEPDETDPMTLTGVELDVDDPETVRDMAACFIEEYIRLGHSAETMLDLFRSGEFAGPALAWRQLGAETIRDMIEDEVTLWGPRARRLAVDQTTAGWSLPVLG